MWAHGGAAHGACDQGGQALGLGLSQPHGYHRGHGEQLREGHVQAHSSARNNITQKMEDGSRRHELPAIRVASQHKAKSTTELHQGIYANQVNTIWNVHELLRMVTINISSLNEVKNPIFLKKE